MFKSSQLREIVTEGVAGYKDENKIKILQSLKEFRNVWNSGGCRQYIINFGKAAGILQNKNHEFAEVFNTAWRDFLNSGTYLSTIAITGSYDSTELLVYFSKANRAINSLEEYEKEIDKIFAEGFR